MNILKKYIIKEIIPPALIALIIFTFVIVMNRLLLLADMLIRKGVEIENIAKILLYHLPSVISLTIPIAVLLGIIIGINRLASDSEVIAIRAGGISIYKLTVPILLFASCLWIINMYIMLYSLPEGNTKLREMQYKLVTSQTILKDVKPRVFNETLTDKVLYISDVDEGENWWKNVFICKSSLRNVPNIILAKRGTPLYDKKTGKLGLRLYDGILYEAHVLRPQRNERRSSFSQFNMMLSEGDEAFSQTVSLQKDERSMTLGELRQNIERKKGRNYLEATVINKQDYRQYISFQLFYNDNNNENEPLLDLLTPIEAGKGQHLKIPYYLPYPDEDSSVKLLVKKAINQNDTGVVLYEKGWTIADLQTKNSSFNNPKIIVSKEIDDNDFRILRLSFAELNQPEDYKSLMVEVHKKFSIPFACIIFGILGLPLGLSFQRAGKSAGYIFGIIIFLLYYVVLMNGEVLADKGKISPFLGMWAANILFAIVGLIMLFQHGKAAYLLSNASYYVKQKFQRIFSLFKKQKVKESKSTGPVKAGKRPRVAIQFPRLSWRFPNMLDRYILLTFIRICVLVFVSVYAVFALVDFVDINEEIERNQLSYSLMADYFKFKFPQILSYILPITILMSALITLAILSKFREIIAVKAAGISIFRVFLPLIVIAAFASGIHFLIEDNILPYSNQRLIEVDQTIKGAPPQTYYQDGSRWVFGKGNRIFHYLAQDQQQEIINRFSVFDFDPATFTLIRRIFVQQVTWNSSEDKWLEFKQGWIQSFGSEGIPELELFEFKQSIDIEEKPSYFDQELKLPDEMNFSKLREHIIDLQRRGYSTLQHRVDLHWKISFPFLSLIFTLMGMPFSLKVERKGTLTGIFISLALVVVYWIFMVAFKNLGYAGFLPPWLAAWSPNIIFGIVGGYFILITKT